MRILYPDDPLEPKRAESLFRSEHDAVRAAGVATSIFSFEDFERGRFSASPGLDAGEPVLYRGWMVSPEGYARLEAAVRAAGARPVTSLEAYRAAHHLPQWYPLIEEWTAETRVFGEGTDFVEAFSGSNWPGYFVKDYVKSLTTSGGSLVSDAHEIARVVAQLKKYRGEIEGGVCVRKQETYIASSERRYFVANGEALAADDHVPDIVHACAQRISNPFVSVDVARRADGVLRVIEIGDGQVSDRKEWDVEQFVAVLLRLERGVR